MACVSTSQTDRQTVTVGRASSTWRKKVPPTAFSTLAAQAPLFLPPCKSSSTRLSQSRTFQNTLSEPQSHGKKKKKKGTDSTETGVLHAISHSGEATRDPPPSPQCASGSPSRARFRAGRYGTPRLSNRHPRPPNGSGPRGAERWSCRNPDRGVGACTLPQINAVSPRLVPCKGCEQLISHRPTPNRH
eukprot:361427-Rhodomonas_salina.1